MKPTLAAVSVNADATKKTNIGLSTLGPQNTFCFQIQNARPPFFTVQNDDASNSFPPPEAGNLWVSLFYSQLWTWPLISKRIGPLIVWVIEVNILQPLVSGIYDIWKSCFTERIHRSLVIYDLWMKSGRFTRNPFPKMGWFKLIWYDHIRSEWHGPWIFIAANFHDFHSGYASVCGVTGADFRGPGHLDREGSRPLEFLYQLLFHTHFTSHFQ